MEELIEKLKKELIQELNLEEMTPEDIDADAPLFGDGLGLDSIDALEIILILERNYGIKIKKPEEGEGREIFRSVRSLAEFISTHQK
ncbi:MAG: phosphopantetheine-binding protein [Dysgonomonas sp.]|uniref:phosphopantetheine-binding protein n=1 Tax=Dysgonomonas sp. TaxID=1891233 RepID=UPI003A8C1869